MAELKKFEFKSKQLSKTTASPMIGLFARAGEGKTFCCATISDKWDPVNPCSLDDTYWITADKDGGFDGFRERKVDIPHWADLSEYSGKEFNLALKAACAEARTMAKDKAIKAVIVDPVSSIDRVWTTDLVKEFPGRALYPALGGVHRQFIFSELFTIPATIITTFHTKKSVETDVTKSEALNMDANDQLVIDLAGQASASLYRAQCALLMPLKRVRQTGKPEEYWLYPRGTNGMEDKSRFACLADKEPANLRLIMDKIRNVVQG